MKTQFALLLGALVTTLHLAGQSPGSLDTTFAVQKIGYDPFSMLVVQPDGKILVGGSTGTTLGLLSRLNANGTLDPTFQLTGPRKSPRANEGYGAIHSLGVDPDGNMVLAGGNWYVPGMEKAGLVRLHPGGTVDPSFAPRYHETWTSQDQIEALPGGEYLIATCCGIGAPEDSLIRLLHNGEIDPRFKPRSTGTTPKYHGFAVQPDGRIVLLLRDEGRVIRLMADGSEDPSFKSSATFSGLEDIQIAPDGKIVVGGNFPAVDQWERPGLVRLLANGEVDVGFVPFSKYLDVSKLVIQRDGKIILPLSFVGEGHPKPRLVRLKTDGSLDDTFVADQLFPFVTVPEGVVGHYEVQALALQADAKLVVTLQDTDDHGLTFSRILRLHGDGWPYIEPTSIRAGVNEAMEFQITAATNRTVIVEASSDLKAGPWSALATFPGVAGRGPIHFSDSAAANGGRRFYRAVSP